jgi:hypothetical protein
LKLVSSISASVGSIIASLSTLFCCLPFAFAAAVGTAGASAFLLKYRIWFLLLSIALIGVGFWQQRRARLCSLKGRWIGDVLLWTSVALILGMILFPQQIAGFIADRLGQQ